MKAYIHARLDRAARAALDELKAKTGQSDSELVRRGLIRSGYVEGLLMPSNQVRQAAVCDLNTFGLAG